MAIILPGRAVREMVDEAKQRAFERLPETKCPAASLGRYADSGNSFLRCAIEQQHFPVSAAPLVVMNWCCDGYEGCPTWQAAKSRDPVIERTLAAREQAKQDGITRRQIAAGVRVDDRGEADRRLDEAAARAKADMRAAYARGDEDDFDIRDYLPER
jgi:hypothetical protein